MAFPVAMPAIGWLVKLATGGVAGIRGILMALRATKVGKWVWFGLFLYAGGIIGRLFMLLGVTLVANTFVTPQLTSLISGPILGLEPDWRNFIALTKLDQAITIVLSAVVIRTVDQVQVRRRRESWQAPL